MSTFNPEIKINTASKRRLSLKQKLRHYFVTGRFHNPAGYTLLGLMALLIGLGVAFAGPVFALLILAVCLGLPVAYGVIAYPKFGIITLLVAAYLVMWFNRMAGDYPLGTLMDGLEALLVIGFTLKHKFEKNWDFLKNPISIMILVWIAYNFLEALNPDAESRLA